MSRPAKKRLFVALPLSDAFFLEISYYFDDLEKVKGVRTKSLPTLHVTVQYIGQVLREDLSAVERALAQVAEEVKPFDLYFEGIGVLQQHVCGMFEEDESFDELVHVVRGKLSRVVALEETYKDGRAPAKPHVTLATCGRHKGLPAFMTETPLVCDRLRLYESRGQGYYTLLKEYPLRGR